MKLMTMTSLRVKGGDHGVSMQAPLMILGTEILGILFLVSDFGYTRSTNVMVIHVQFDIQYYT